MDIVKVTLETRENKDVSSKQGLSSETIKKLLRQGVRSDAVMIHGAGVESLLTLFDTGFFPCGNGRTHVFWDAICCTVAREKAGEQEITPLPTALQVNFPTASEHARLYARLNAEELHYATLFRHRTGVSLAIGIKMYWNMAGGCHHRVLKEDSLKVNEAYDYSITEGAKKRKGVLLAFYEEGGIAQLRRKKDPDGDGVYICRPKGSPGIPTSFIGGIGLLGKTEGEIVQKYIRLRD
ncbi:hypothetical protein D4S03_06985 [bacterium]|nr:MAG: hypothetical protein D4S03_06985 [bacterium]